MLTPNILCFSLINGFGSKDLYTADTKDSIENVLKLCYKEILF